MSDNTTQKEQEWQDLCQKMQGSDNAYVKVWSSVFSRFDNEEEAKEFFDALNSEEGKKAVQGFFFAK
jgi:ABC-type molybdate transport system substrate-binding protein